MNVFTILLIWVHLTAATFWVGGMLFLSLVAVPVIKQDVDPLSAQRWFVGLARRFRTFVWGALSILVGTGVLLLSRLVEVSSSPMTWPAPIIGKLVLVLTLIGISLLHDKVIGPKVRILKQKSSEELTNGERWLIRISPIIGRMTLLLGLGVLLMAVFIARI